jgi:hypothetical protein
MANLATITTNILADSGIDDINVVVTTGSYTNPSWIVSLPWTKITGTPTTLAGYGIADAYTQTQVNTLLNAKQNTLTLTTTGTSGAATLVGATLNIPQYQSVITNPVTGTGTTNYLPKFTGTSTIGNSQVFDAATGVGIGTTSVDSKLTVNGQVRVSDLTLQGFYQARTSDTAGAGVFGGNSFVLRNGATSEDLCFDVFNRSTSVWYTPLIIKNTGNVGIGTINPSARLQVVSDNLGGTAGDQSIQSFFFNNNGNTSFLEIKDVRTSTGADWTFAAKRIQMRIDSTYMGYVQFNGTGNNAGISFGAGTTATAPGNVSERMRITAAGRLLLGTTTESTFLLDVNGTGRFTTTTATSAGFRSYSEASLSNLWNDATPGIEIFNTIANSGFVGAGAGIKFFLSINGNPQAGIFGVRETTTASALTFYTQNANSSVLERLRITSTGNVGIGTASPSYALTVGQAGTTANSFIQIASSTTGAGSLYFGDTAGVGVGSYAGFVEYAHSSNTMVFGTASTTRLTISSTGAATFSSLAGTGTRMVVADANGLLSTQAITVGTVTSVAALTIGTTGTNITSTVANGTTTPVITLNVPNASAANRGALTAADWTTFNGKQNQLNGTGFVKASGTTITYDNSIYQVTSEKAQPSGYASLDTNGKVPLAQINDALIGNVNYQGLWNAATNTPTLVTPPAIGTKGYYYIVSAAGTFAGISFEVGDWIISNGSAWEKVDNTDAVSSVFGRTGNVVAANGDYNTSLVTENTNLYFTNARVLATALTGYVVGTNAALAATDTILGAFGKVQAQINAKGSGTVTSVAALTLGTTGTDLTSTVATGTTTPVITLNVPSASAANRGVLTAADWTAFNGKQDNIVAGTTAQYYRGDKTFQTLNTTAVAEGTNLYFTTARVLATALTGYVVGTNTALAATDTILGAFGKVQAQINARGTVTSVAALTIGTTGTNITSTVANGTTTPVITLNVPNASAANRGALTAADWTTFNNKQNALTNPVTGTGSTGQVAYFNGTSSITSESSLFWDATNDRLGIGTSLPTNRLHLGANINQTIKVNSATSNAAYLGIFQDSAGISVNRDLATGTFQDIGKSTAAIYLKGEVSNGYITFETTGTNNVNSTERMRIDSSGNLGLGVTPSAWASGYSAFQLNATASLAGVSSGVLRLMNNSFVNTSGADTYITTGVATAYLQNAGQHAWYNAPSGTFNTAISFTQVMTLGTNGGLSIGTPSAAPAQGLLVVGAAIFSSTIRSNATNGFAIGSIAGYRRIQYDLANTRFGLLTDGNALANLEAAAATFSSSVTTGGGIQTNISKSGSGVENVNFLQLRLFGTNAIGDSLDIRYLNSAGNNIANISAILGGDNVAYGSLAFSTRNFFTDSMVEVMRINNRGNVGIGITAPTTRLDIGNGTLTLPTLRGRTYTLSNVASANPNFINGTGFNSIPVRVGDIIDLPFSQTRTVTAVTDTQITVNAAWTTSFAGVNVEGRGAIVFQTNNLDRLTIAATGNVGIGTTTPDVFGRFYTQTLGLSSSGSTAIQINGGTGGYGQIDFGAAGVRTAGISASANETQWGSVTAIPAIIYTNGSERMRITSGGNLDMSANSDINFGGSGKGIYLSRSGLGPRASLTTRLNVNWVDIANSSDWNGVTLAASGGNVLIGTTTDNSNRLRVNGTIFSDSSVTATSFFESSDSRIKTLVQDDYQAKGIESVTAKLYIKNGKEELGYFAQDLEGILPSAVSKGSDGLLNLSYREVHTAKIAYLEQKIKQLENELGKLSK